jgi:hypothetical protein
MQYGTLTMDNDSTTKEALLSVRILGKESSITYFVGCNAGLHLLGSAEITFSHDRLPSFHFGGRDEIPDYLWTSGSNFGGNNLPAGWPER